MNPRSLAFLAGGLLLLVALFMVLRPPEATTPAPAPVARTVTPELSATSASTPAEPVESSPPVAAPAPTRFELLVKGGKLVSGPSTLQVRQGDALVLRITSDRHDELHLHGYDLSLELKAGEPAELAFTAEKSGRFEYELHHAHLDLGALEVLPR